MSRLRWNEMERHNHSEIEKLDEERRQLVFNLRKETREDRIQLARWMLWLTLVDSALLVGLALTTQSVYGGTSLVSLLLRLVYILSAGAAALLLALSMVFAMAGPAWEESTGQFLPALPMPRQALLDLALAELAQLRQGLQRRSILYQRARRLLTAALIPYLFVVAILILQVF